MTQQTVVLRALGLGDLVTVVPALKGLRRALPRHRQLVTVAPWLTELAEYLDLGDEWITGAVGWPPAAQAALPARKALETAQLRGLIGPSQCPAVGVNLRGTRTPLHEAVLALQPQRYVAFHNPDVPATASYPTWDPTEHEVLSWCRLLQAFGIPSDPQDLFFRAPDPPRGTGGRRRVLVHPGAGKPARHWPADRWAAVVRELALRGYEVALSCARHEAQQARHITELADCAGTVVPFHDAEIIALVNAIAGCALLISADTGVQHLAHALRVPSVVLFGPSSPARWGPLPSEAAIHASIWVGRTGDPDSEELDPGLEQISVRDVLAEVDRLRVEGIV